MLHPWSPRPSLHQQGSRPSRCRTHSQEKATELGAAIEKHGGEKLPQVKALLASAAQKVKAAAQSEQVRRAGACEV